MRSVLLIRCRDVQLRSICGVTAHFQNSITVSKFELQYTTLMRYSFHLGNVVTFQCIIDVRSHELQLAAKKSLTAPLPIAAAAAAKRTRPLPVRYYINNDRSAAFIQKSTRRRRRLSHRRATHFTFQELSCFLWWNWETS